MAKVTIRVEQDNGSTIEMEGNEKGATVTSKEPYTGSGNLLVAMTELVAHLDRLSRR